MRAVAFVGLPRVRPLHRVVRAHGVADLMRDVPLLRDGVAPAHFHRRPAVGLSQGGGAPAAGALRLKDGCQRGVVRILLEDDAGLVHPHLRGRPEGFAARAIAFKHEVVRDDHVVFPSVHHALGRRGDAIRPGLPRIAAWIVVAEPIPGRLVLQQRLRLREGAFQLAVFILEHRVVRVLLLQDLLAPCNGLDVDILLLVLGLQMLWHAPGGKRAQPAVHAQGALILHGAAAEGLRELEARAGLRIPPDGLVEPGGPAAALAAGREAEEVQAVAQAEGVAGAHGHGVALHAEEGQASVARFIGVVVDASIIHNVIQGLFSIAQRVAAKAFKLAIRVDIQIRHLHVFTLGPTETQRARARSVKCWLGQMLANVMRLFLSIH
mmetsp:Transcript_133975/g.317710  ORF Transcript_133975/g.317710 Transcript_133975/m.317710 type:complete len:379 (-) Transcript_133975:312-1448(-)